MEHFELYNKYRESLPSLKTGLRGLGLGTPGLETLGNILENHFVGLFEECNEEGKTKDYQNRQPKPQSSISKPPRSTHSSLRRRVNRDSACEIVLEENSDFHGLGDAERYTASHGDPSPQPMLFEESLSQLAVPTSQVPHGTLSTTNTSMANQHAFLGIEGVPGLGQVSIPQWDTYDYAPTDDGWYPVDAYCSHLDSGSHGALLSQARVMDVQEASSQNGVGAGQPTHIQQDTGFAGFGYLPTRHR